MAQRSLRSLVVSTLLLATATAACSAEVEDVGDDEGAARTAGVTATLTPKQVAIDETVRPAGVTQDLRCTYAATLLEVSLGNAQAAAEINRVLTPRTSRFVEDCRTFRGPEHVSEDVRPSYNGAGVLAVAHDVLATQLMTTGADRGRKVLTSTYEGRVFDLATGRELHYADVFGAGAQRIIERACADEVRNVYGADAEAQCRVAVTANGDDAMTFYFDQFRAHFKMPAFDLTTVSVPWSSLQAHVVHPAVKKVPRTTSAPDICRAFPACDEGDTKVGTSESDCLQDIGCYERTACGHTIWCSDAI